MKSLAISAVFVLCMYAGALFSFSTAAKDIHLQLRKRVESGAGGAWRPVTINRTLQLSQTAIVICDMWDRHWCDGATNRVEKLARKMEPVLERARAAGVLIIHAPSETMSFYANAPGRLLAENAPAVTPPSDPTPQAYPALPIDDSDGGCDTGNKEYKAWTRETPLLSIKPGDAISDKGSEIYNLIQERHIKTVLIMGVHANMCILNRTFGIKQMTRWGVPCILVRDLTDAMYNPKSKPYVSHAAGTELVIEYIEKYGAPSVTSSQLMAALQGR
ncbi:MAG TPA: isochorismatase family protein [Bryobacteraceae bacterium]|nr:isochorismatase family protein [Bryobacteraceae bacterium]